jgi:hypothetical protein
MLTIDLGLRASLSAFKQCLLMNNKLTIHVDGNEAEIGQVFKSINVPRDEYFVTTKLYVIYSPLMCQ